ncbi:DNA-(apurinic or apyrimidinic site) lyase [Ascochyta rabiei]|uniref:Catalytic n=1 Tax=Didymella rabiei TaxID=5454 RepID=A0A163CH78_DIDRA|nr:DNA-(apurinic or apyrimidinic site) lyase [Ascochyta rabiei]KZM22459.1 catalytic [Ascochyta rabiei]UPX10176.1 DNA-(apurinic or apyrimidinic site) lyase [Ascochyta rabiei]
MQTRSARSGVANAAKGGITKSRKMAVPRRRSAVISTNAAVSSTNKSKTGSISITKGNPSSVSPTIKTTTGDTKYKTWFKHAHFSPFPNFESPTEEQCRRTHEILEQMHGDTVRKNFAEMSNPEQHYPHVMDALVVAQLSQATAWSNAQRAMRNMANVYGSTFAYQKILDGGVEKLQDALRPGGMQNRKAKMLTKLLLDVKERHGNWDLDFLFKLSNEDAMKEVLQYHGIGPKSAFCLLSICLQRQSFAVDTHIYRITGLWGWRPKNASREKAQSHLDAKIPSELKFALHYLFIVHGRECPVCRGNGNVLAECEFERLYSKRA